MKVVVDMNLSPAWVDLLVRQGHDAEHWSTVGRATASDREILEWSRQRNHIVLTHDLDFGAILAATGNDSPSVVQLRTQDVTPEAVGPVVLALLRNYKTELEQGALISLDESNARLRTLPLR